uniref:Uncharacterized protein n=1 Tax=Glossina pallidipes TaxID=7398 RepID=A0A1A9Z6Q2_GLOPL
MAEVVRYDDVHRLTKERTVLFDICDENRYVVNRTSSRKVVQRVTSVTRVCYANIQTFVNKKLATNKEYVTKNAIITVVYLRGEMHIAAMMAYFNFFGRMLLVFNICQIVFTSDIEFQF